jgi:hypothetical protein
MKLLAYSNEGVRVTGFAKKVGRGFVARGSKCDLQQCCVQHRYSIESLAQVDSCLEKENAQRELSVFGGSCVSCDGGKQSSWILSLLCLPVPPPGHVRLLSIPMGGVASMFSGDW